MLTNKQIQEIREHLEKAQNPLFFFDNDNDGLISFLLLRRYIDRGKGVHIKRFPALDKTYYRKVRELKPDYIFILDKPEVGQDFIDRAKQDNIPIVWIDHHQVEKSKDDYVNYYNPFFNDKTNEPVAYLCYKIADKKEDIWLAMIGCISDYYFPDFYKEFEKKYPEWCKKNPKNPFDLLYGSKIGEISRILDFSLKDTTTNVVKMMKFMSKVKNPIEILEENSKTKQILSRFNDINSKYQKLIEKARKCVDNNLIFFRYGGGFCLGSNISNQLSYEFPDKFIVAAYVGEDRAIISLRGNNILKITKEAIKNIEGATGGGHKHATGAQMNSEDLPEFKKKIKELIG